MLSSSTVVTLLNYPDVLRPLTQLNEDVEVPGAPPLVAADEAEAPADSKPDGETADVAEAEGGVASASSLLGKTDLWVTPCPAAR